MAPPEAAGIIGFLAATQRAMYEAFYGFADKPFDQTPDPAYLYRSETHANALELIRYAIDRQEGFAVITGDTGTGKTTLCRAVAEGSDAQTFVAVLLEPPKSEDDLLEAILRDLGVLSRGGDRSGAARPTTQDLVNTLYDFLRSLVPLNARAALIVDEAHELPPSILEQIRIFSNLETDKDKLLQIALVGQPSLLALLKSPDLRQLDQRVSIRYQLRPLTEDETGAYITHRLTAARAERSVTFTEAAMRLVHGRTRGVPGLINMLCHGALIAGCSADTGVIDEVLVASAAEGVDLGTPARPRRSMFGRLFGRRG